jgi:tetratricopeptide (TPR) repeat protein
MPGFAPARMLSGMVFIARGALDRAGREASIGAEAQRQHLSDHTPLPAVGLHWLRGLILAAGGDPRGAVACFDEEMAAGGTGHIYAREFAVNALVAAGFTQLARKDSPAASAAFTQVLAEAADHPKALVGVYAVAALGGDQRALAAARTATESAIAALARGERHAEAALVAAGAQIVRGRIDEAVEGLDRLLATAPAGPAGWIIPVDPMLAAIHASRGKQALFSRLAARAA